MKKCGAALLVLCVILSGCVGNSKTKQHTITYLNLFDTVTTVIGTGSEESFRQETQKIYDQLYRYHQLFDIYNDYEGLNNLKTVNDQAGVAPVKVDRAIIELLLDCKEYYKRTEGKVNVAMGGVLKLWHDARTAGLENPENARLPDGEALAEAAKHMDMASVLINETDSTVFLSDPEMSLDVGAIAKGWACQRVADSAPEGMLISVGGNICATGAKANGAPWIIGVQNPEGGSEYLQTLAITDGCVVTSGDYQRVYTVDGKNYHHIIDPQTQMPSVYWRSVTVVCQDSALADAMSTALFLLPLEEGKSLAERWGVRALWVDAQGKEYMTPGFQNLLAQ